MKFLSSLIVVFSSLIAASTNAIVIWDESINGNASTMPTLELQAGTNEIIGTSRWIGDVSDPTQFTEPDWFNLILQNGFSIQAITAEVFNPVLTFDTSQGALSPNAYWTLQDSTYAFRWLEYISIADGATYANVSELPVFGLNHFVLNQSSGLSVDGPFDLYWEYRVIIDVTESTHVPEPSSFWLLLFAMCIFLLSSKRSRRIHT